MSVMSISKKSHSSEGQIQNTVWFRLQTRRVYYAQLIGNWKLEIAFLPMKYLRVHMNSFKRVRAFQIELEFGSVGFWGEGKTGVPGEKSLGAKERTNNKLNPHMASTLGFEPGPHWWEASALTTAPPLAPLLLVIISILFIMFSSQKKFCKKGVIVAIALLNNMKVTWTCCIKTFFLDTRSQASFSLTLTLLGMLYEMKVKSNLVHQINKHHLVRQKIFS